jgi:hypothetical protein
MAVHQRDPKTGRFAGAESDSEMRPTSLANLQPANLSPQANRSHGAYAVLSRERLDTKTQELAQALGEDAPVRAEDGGLPRHDTVAVEQLAEAMCRLEDIALSRGSLTSIELHSRCGAKFGDRTFSRARRALEDAGEVIAVQEARHKRYALAAAQQQAA